MKNVKIHIFLITISFSANAQTEWTKQREKAELKIAYMERAQDFLQSKQLDSSIFYYKSAFVLDSSHHISFSIGDLYEQVEMLDSAIKYYTFSAESNPKYTDAILKRGILYREKEKNRLALLDFDRVIQLNSMYDSIAFPNRAMTKTSLGLFESAMSDFDRAIQLNPTNYSLWNDRGVCKFNLGNLEGALKDFNKTLALAPDHDNGYSNRAQVYLQLGKYERAIEDLKQHIVYNSEHMTAHFQIGLLYSSIKEYEKSITYLNRAYELGDRSFDLYFYRGLSNYYLARDKNAISDLKKAIKLKPKRADTYFYLGVCKNSILTESGCDDIKKAIDLGFEEAKANYNEECLN